MTKQIITFVFILFILTSCNKFEQTEQTDVLPKISPDYSGVTIPCNIAPLNFYVIDKADKYLLEVKGANSQNFRLHSSNGGFRFPENKWKDLLAKNKDGVIAFQLYKKTNGTWEKHLPFSITVSSDSISPYIAYRTIDPGNILWSKMGIYQRCLEDFNESAIMVNSLTKGNCINCHSFSSYNPNKFMLHIRKDYGGTLIANNGNLSLVNTKTPKTISNATYPAWHPSGKYIAFSVNEIHQQFFAQTDKYEVVQDKISDIILFDIDKNSISTCPQLSTRRLENIPAWSPDGKFLYYISGNLFDEKNYKNIKYDLLRIAFDPETAKWGKVDTLLTTRQTGKSISFPSASPDGRYLMFCMANYGYFTIHNKESNICLMDLATNEYHLLECNSGYVESYPTWSSNGHWIMFVSKRDNDMFSRPWFSHINNKGEASKPFVLPQEDAHFYDSYVLNFNRPEFINGKVALTPDVIKEFVAQNQAQQVSFDSTFHVDGRSGATKTQQQDVGVKLEN